MLESECKWCHRCVCSPFQVIRHIWKFVNWLKVNIHMSTKTCVTGNNLVLHNSLPVLPCATMKDDILTYHGMVCLQDLESCIGCMQKTANVKLQKLCASPQEGSCVQCYCRPMWCLECMGKWFASRQNQQEPETWLAGRAPCPTCRAVFCMLDISMVTWPEQFHGHVTWTFIFY